MKKLISVMLCAVFTLSLICTIGCKTTPSEEFKETSTYLVRGGYSDYRIVKPQNATSNEEFAVSELHDNFLQATGVDLKIISDTGMTFDGGKYFSVGRTSLLEGSGVKASYEELGRDGCRLVTKGDTVWR